MKPPRLSYFVTSLTKSAASFTTTAGEHGPLVTAGRSPLRLAGILSLSAVTLIGTYSAQAGGVTTRTWDGGGGDSNWNTITNWNGPDTKPTSADIAAFGGAFGAGTTTIGLGGNQSALSLSITTATAFSINNNILTLANGDIDRTATTGNTTINSGILLGADGAWSIAGSSTAGTLIVNGIIDDGVGTFALDKTGAGTLTLNNANTFGGGLLLNAGTVSLGNNTAAGLGTLDLSGGTLQAVGAARTLANTVSITQNSTIGGTLDLTFNGNVSQDNSRTLTVNNTGITTFSGSTLTLAPNNSPESLTFDIAATSGGVIVSSVVQNGTGSGADGLIKDGLGRLTLSRANTYTGATSINAGVLRAGNSTALGTVAGGVSVTSGAALELDGTAGALTIGAEALTLDGTGVSAGGGLRNISGNNSWAGEVTINSSTRINSDAGRLTLDVASGNAITGTNDNLTFGGEGNITVADAIATGSGTLTKDGNGTLTLSAANSYTGLTTISAGALRAGNNTALGTIAGGVSVTSGAALELDGTAGALTIGAEALTLNGTGISNGGALRNIAGNNSYAGVITLGSASRINSDAGTLTIDSAAGSITGNFGLTLGGAGNITLADAFAPVTTAQTLTKDGAGTATLNVANTHTGLTTVTAGTLAYGISNALSTGNVTVNGATAILNLGANRTDSVGIVTLAGGGQINGTGNSTLTSTGTFEMQSGSVSAILGGAGIALNKTTADTVTLSAANTYTGLTTVSAGTLLYGASNVISTGNVTVNGATAILNLGASQSDSVGIVTLAGGGQINGTGNSTLTSTGTFEMQSGSVSAILGGAGIALNKTTADTVILSAANTYTGLTTVSGGTLFANNATGSATGTGAVSVGASGALGGTGTITPTGTNAINVTGVLAPGGSVGTGTLTFDLTNTSGKVTMNGGSGFELLLAGVGGTITSPGSSDMLTIAGAAAGDFAFSGNSVNFLNTGAVGFYKLFDTSSNNANTWTGLTVTPGGTGLVTAGLTYTGLTSGLTGNFLVGTGTGIGNNGGTTGDIYFQVIPEPGAALLGGLGTLLLLRRRRTA
jgi:autotransporter-associated beta strand protein